MNKWSNLQHQNSFCITFCWTATVAEKNKSMGENWDNEPFTASELKWRDSLVSSEQTRRITPVLQLQLLGDKQSILLLKKSKKKKEIGYLILQRHEQEQGPQQRARINHIHTVTAAKSAKMPDCRWRCHCSRRGDICSSLQRNNGKPHHVRKKTQQCALVLQSAAWPGPKHQPVWRGRLQKKTKCGCER